MQTEVGLTALRSSALAGCSTWARPGSAVSASLSRMTLCTSVAMRAAGSFLGAPAVAAFVACSARPASTMRPRKNRLLWTHPMTSLLTQRALA